MRVLLDTHAFIWWNDGDERLSSRAKSVIAELNNQVLLSSATAWEIAIKHGRGLLRLPERPDKYVLSRMVAGGMDSLAIDIPHGLRAGELPDIHRDPFDRILVAQAQVEGVPILTSDANIARYDVEVIW